MTGRGRQWGWREASLVAVFAHLPPDVLDAVKLLSYSLMATAPSPLPPREPLPRLACQPRPARPAAASAGEPASVCRPVLCMP